MLGEQVIGVGRRGQVVRHDVRALEQLGEADRLRPVLRHHELLDVGIVGQHVHAERAGPHGHRAGHVTEGDEAESLAHQPREA